MPEPIAVVPGGNPEFTTGIFGCFSDINGCLDNVVCYPCMVGRHCEAVEGNPNTPNTMWCLGTLVACFVFPIALLPIAPCLRTKLRERHGITGGCLGDWVCGVFCAPCTTCQINRELTIRNTWPGGACFQSSPPAIV